MMLRIIDGGRTDPPPARKRPAGRSLKVRALTFGMLDNGRFAVVRK